MRFQLLANPAALSPASLKLAIPDAVPLATWFAALPSGKPVPLQESDEGANSIHVAISSIGSTPTVGITSMDGKLEIVALGARGPSTRFRIP